MFLLDTNVISESRKLSSGKADANVTRWLQATSPAQTFISVFTVFELELGVRLKERQDAMQGTALRRWLESVILPGFADRVLEPTTEIALRCAALHVPDPASDRDAWIAATALEHGLTVVTRNVADFQRTGVKLLNPWD
jgi:predicted nucleic acid-binding protein